MNAPHALLAALDAEGDALDQLAARADAQLAALGERDTDRLADAADAVAEAVAGLDAARQSREREAGRAARAAGLDAGVKLQALADALPAGEAARVLAARDRVRARARHADARCDALQFALGYAASLGRDLLDAWHRLDVPRPARVYTAAGAAASVAPAAVRLNQTG